MTTAPLPDRRPPRFRRSEDGFMTIEFMIWFPVFLFVFLCTVEAAVFFTRITMLDRALNLVVREVRIGGPASQGPELFRERLCQEVLMFPDCRNSLKIEMVPVSLETWAGVDAEPLCVDRDAAIQLDDEYSSGGSNELMMVRTCMLADPLFPTTGFGLRLPKDDAGAVRIISTSTFVNEPRGS